ncbi:MAG: InlB B-repeat-containing protein, partial [Clostridia bacterium]|nr:InlB B-repeat-containing protein [Clostridia bacterium]
MKKFLSVIALIMVLSLSIACFVSCKPEETPPADDSDKVTVCWYQGSKLLKEEKVAKGTKLTTWTPPVVEGKDFTGWYAEASLSQEFDFETAINADTDIFAKYTSNVFVADDKEYYLIGTGSGDMKQSGWNHDNSMAHLVMTKTENASANVYEIEILMYAGDAFQICYGGTYDGQVGIGYVPGVEYADGTNRYDNNTYTAADKKFATVKNAAGEVVFEGHDEFNKEYWTWNVFLAEGQDGIYKIIYTTYPDHPADNTITYELVEKKEPLAETHDMYICGTVSNWDFSDDFKMAADDTKENYSFLLNITEPAEIKLRNKIGDVWYGAEKITVVNECGTWNDGGNLALAAGVYKIAYNVESDTATIEAVAKSFWLAGVVNGGQFWNCGSGIEFEKVNDTTYKAYYTFTEADTDASWMIGFVGACKAVYGYAGWNADNWYGNPENGDNVTVDSYGLYELVLTLDATDSGKGSLTATKLEGYFLVGTIGDGDTWRAESQNKIEVTGDAVSTTYTWTQKDNADWLGADQISAVKIINVDATGAVTWYGNATNGDNV